MKKATLLLLCGALAFCACRKDPVPETPSKDADLTGEKVDVSGFPGSARKLFILNEGQKGSNNSSLDFLRFSDGNYVTGVFRKMNPSVEGGLGDVGNDIKVHGDELWIIVNNSGIVEVVSAKDETEIAAIAVPTPRSVAFDDAYAYVTSWAGAFVTGNYDLGYYSITDSSNPKGQVYRIDLKTKKVVGSVEVGYQPEGIACHDGKLYVANSGGISSQVAPDYSYDNTLSIIDTRSFTVSRTVEVQVNLKDVYVDGIGNVYVTSLGDFGSIYSGLYRIAEGSGTVSKVSDYVSVSALCGDTVYCIGTETEHEWTATSHIYKAWSCRDGIKKDLSLTVSAKVPYALCVLDADAILVGDAGDYFNPGTVSFYFKGSSRWTVDAGVCPGHFAVY